MSTTVRSATNRSDSATNRWVHALFDPARVALVGASGKAGKLGSLFMRNLLDGFAGEVIPIHPSDDTIFERRAFPTICAVPGSVDLAVIVAPESAVLAAVEDCAAAGVRAAVIVSGGFAETGPAGKALQDRIAATARAGNVRLIGPNCFGLINVQTRLNASLGMGLPEAGGVSLFTQSGAYGMAAFSRSKEGDVGFAKVIAPGNKADLDEVEIVAYLGTDQHTRVVALLLESICDGAAFVDVVRAVTRSKPVVIVKTGRRGAAQRAAASHTDALAGDYRIAAAALRQAGARLVDDGLALLDVAAALDVQPQLAGRRVAIITNSGGTGVELTDLLEERGLLVPALSAPLQHRIRALIPAYGSATNPVDVTTDWPRFASMYGDTLRLLLASGEVDAVVPVLLQRSALLPDVTARIVAETHAARRAGSNVAVHVCWVGPAGSEENRRTLLAAGIPCHPWAARTAQTLAACLKHPTFGVPDVEGSLARPHVLDPGRWLPAAATFATLTAAGVTFAPWRLVQTADAAVHAAQELGFPVVLKAVRPELVHKSDAGGVRVGITDESAVRAVSEDFTRRLGPGAMLVQKHIFGGTELVIGAVRDPQFGPLIVFGLGGVWVEVLDDVALRCAPFDEREALSMIGDIRAQAILDGARGTSPIDRVALARLLSAISVWAARAPWFESLDINPLIASGAQFTAVDARIRVRALQAPPDAIDGAATRGEPRQ